MHFFRVLGVRTVSRYVNHRYREFRSNLKIKQGAPGTNNYRTRNSRPLNQALSKQNLKVTRSTNSHSNVFNRLNFLIRRTRMAVNFFSHDWTLSYSVSFFRSFFPFHLSSRNILLAPDKFPWTSACVPMKADYLCDSSPSIQRARPIYTWHQLSFVGIIVFIATRLYSCHQSQREFLYILHYIHIPSFVFLYFFHTAFFARRWKKIFIHDISFLWQIDEQIVETEWKLKPTNVSTKSNFWRQFFMDLNWTLNLNIEFLLETKKKWWITKLGLKYWEKV